MKKQLLSCLALGFIVVLAGIGGGWAYVGVRSNDLLHFWSELPPTPAPAEVVAIWITTVYVRTADDRLLMIDPIRDPHWREITAVPTTDPELSHRIAFGECDRSDPRFRWTALPPRDELACHEAQTRLTVIGMKLTIVRDREARLWFYQTQGSDLPMLGFIGIAISAIASIFLALMIIAVWRDVQVNWLGR